MHMYTWCPWKPEELHMLRITPGSSIIVASAELMSHSPTTKTINFFKRFIYFCYVYVALYTCMYYTLHVYLVPVEVRREDWIAWIWNYG